MPNNMTPALAKLYPGSYIARIPLTAALTIAAVSAQGLRKGTTVDREY